MRKKQNTGKKWLFILALIAIILMVGSSLLVALDDSQPNQLKYNDYRFTYKNNQWKTVINNYEISFYHHPSEVDYLNLTSPEKLNSPLVYTSFSPNQTSQYIDLSRLKFDLASQLSSVYFVHGITEKSEEYSLPIITCQNATAHIPVIKFQKSNQTYIEYNQNCYILHAQTNMDYLKLTERILYQLLGVING